MSSALATRPPRLADLPAPPLLAVAAVAWQRLQLRPGADGAVLLEALAASLVLRLELPVEAVLARPLGLPPAALRRLRRLHPDAERLAIDATAPDGLLRLRTLGPDAAAAVTAPEAEHLPALPLVLAGGDGGAVPVAGLAGAAGLLRQLGVAAVDLVPLASAAVVLELRCAGCRLQLAGGQ